MTSARQPRDEAQPPDGASVDGERPEGNDAPGIRLLTNADEMVNVIRVFQQVWGTTNPVVTTEMLMAISHSGGYISAVVDDRDERVLGASVGILARHHGEEALHSHITGLLAGVRRTGAGRMMKMHQREWALAQGIDWIVWTFDPLVRRNAWFNIAVLGAQVDDYLPSFYGAMNDAINAGDESDRLLVAWHVPTGAPALDDETATDPDVEITTRIATPADIVALRRTEPAAVQRWRHDVRTEFTAALERGERVIGFTRDGEYLFGRPT